MDTKRGCVLVGTDGSATAQVAVRWAAALCSTTEADLVVVTAWTPPFAEVDPDTYAGLLDDARRVLEEQWCGPAREAGAHYRAQVLEGDPRDLLLKGAEEADADLIVVGPRGAGNHPHAPDLGSVTHHLIHHTERPLAAIPALSRPAPPERILVGVDGSAGSASAVQWCVEYAGQLGAEVIAVAAAPPSADRDASSGESECETWAAPLRKAGLRSRTSVVEEEPVSGLIDTSIREQADLLVVGSRGRGGFTGLRLGSTAWKIIRRSGLPVVLVAGRPA
jgi:nucleotide-binding universal stress UspA family protein